MRAGRALLAALAIVAPPAWAQDRPGDFDFYVLALSWSPTWCATEGRGSASPQCREGAGRGFVLHGLWPQREHGWPEFCGGERPPRLPSQLVAEMSDIMPDAQLMAHQWRKHGTCSGLSQEGYFGMAREAFEAIAIPPALQAAQHNAGLSPRQVEETFAVANPGLAMDGMAIACDAGQLEEVRICLTRTLAFRSCEEVDRRGCRQRRLAIPAAD
jgi:ribonuclease T2